MSIVSRWVIRQEHTVGPDDREVDGFLRGDVVERWISDACTAYLERCLVLQTLREQSGLEYRARPRAVADSTRLGQPAAVIVTAGTTEVRPTSFTIALRLRPTTGTGDVVNALWVMGLEDAETGEMCELGDDVR